MRMALPFSVVVEDYSIASVLQSVLLYLDIFFHVVASWFQVNLTATEEIVILADFHENGEWHIDSSSVHRDDIFHDIYPNLPFPKVRQTNYFKSSTSTSASNLT